MNGLKQTILLLCKAFGLFALTRYAYRGRLLILCYHGFELADESSFRPQLFMRGDTFSRRLDILRRCQAVILGLQEALKLLQDAAIPENTVVITIDDGFYSVKAVALPLTRARRHGGNALRNDVLRCQGRAGVQVGRAIPHMEGTATAGRLDLARCTGNWTGRLCGRARPRTCRGASHRLGRATLHRDYSAKRSVRGWQSCVELTTALCRLRGCSAC